MTTNPKSTSSWFRKHQLFTAAVVSFALCILVPFVLLGGQISQLWHPYDLGAFVVVVALWIVILVLASFACLISWIFWRKNPQIGWGIALGSGTFFLGLIWLSQSFGPATTPGPTWTPAATATATPTPNGTPAAGQRLIILPGVDVFRLAFSPDGRELAGGAHDTVHIWDAKTGVKLLHGGPRSLVFGVAFSPDGRWLASACSDKSVQIMDAATGAVLKTLAGHTESAFSVAFSPDGRLLASGDEGGTVILWDPRAGTEVRRLTAGQQYVDGVAFSPDGSLLASASYDVKLWDPATGRQLSALASGPANTVAFSPDGRLLAAGGTDVQIWDVAVRKLLRTLPVNAVAVNSVAFSPDGRLVATGSQDDMFQHGSVRLWEVATGKAFPLTTPLDIVFGVAFSPDGQTLASASSDGRVILWEVP